MKTAVEWLCEQYHLKQDIEIVKQAKEMEKQQIIDAWEDGQNSFSTRTPKQYYKETFKNK